MYKKTFILDGNSTVGNAKVFQSSVEMEQDSKIKSLEYQLRVANEKVEIYKEAVEFYADINNWTTFMEAYSEYDLDRFNGANDVITDTDLDEKEIGGKRAREAITKVEALETNNK